MATVINSTATALPLGGAAAPAPQSGSTLATFQFVAGWMLLIVILIGANKTRLGHVIIYYSLLLMILLIVVSEYAQIAPILNSIQTIGDFNAAQGAPATPGSF